MSGKFKIFLRSAFLAFIAVAGGSLFFTAGKGVESNLVALLGDVAGVGLQEAASAMSNSAKFLVKAETIEAARARLSALGVELPPLGCTWIDGPHPARSVRPRSEETSVFEKCLKLFM